MSFKKVDVSSGNHVSLNQTASPSFSKKVDFKQTMFELLDAHMKAKMTMLIYGNSGYGKSSTIEAYCKDRGFKLEKIYCITLDPLTSSMPVERPESMVFIPNEQLHRLCTATEPTVVIYDETNKFSNPSVENMLNSIFLDREYNGHKFSDKVLVVGAMNFRSRSKTAQELDFSIINRATNVLFQPSESDIKANMKNRVGSYLAGVLPIKCGGEEEFREEVLSRLNQEDIPDDQREGAVARQMDAVGELLIAEPTLSDEALKIICDGRFGDKIGALAYNALKKFKNFLPELTEDNKERVVKLVSTELQQVVQLVKECKDFNLALWVVLETKSPVLGSALVSKWGATYDVDGQGLLVNLYGKGILKL